MRQVADGITHVRITGNAEMLDRVGMGPVDTTHGPKHVEYLRLDGQRYGGHVMGGGRMFADFDMGAGLRANAALVEQKLGAAGGPVAYINGGYYNALRGADRTVPNHVPIGPVTTSDGASPRSIAVPAGYRDMYQSVSFGDGSRYTAGPVVAENGKAIFPEEALRQKRFQFPSAAIKPGELSHAEHPNARAGAVIPDVPGRGRDYRLAVALSSNESRGPKDTGMTMPEWSRTLARLASLDRDDKGRLPPGGPTPGLGLNHDGGPSAQLGLVTRDRSMLVDARQVGEPRTSTLVAFSPRSEPDQPTWMDPED
ncbi:hypothetical protein [Rhizosaccharibacter radicis]|uniref:Uncharacterized protein n=1 Tax=Rhizosaccharibacter radicis TaxID=2782605 RepID=A0ABT1VWN7_9PROT|nr:hypothetical protein [Acetobacteraceae bacterium KSS12]